MGVIARTNKAILYEVDVQLPVSRKHYRRLPCYEIYIIAADGRWQWKEGKEGRYYTSLKKAKVQLLLESI